MKNVRIISLLFAIIALATACTKDFEEANTNPNAPSEVTPALLLPGVERDFMNTVMNEAWGIGNIVIQQTAKNQFVNEDRYLWGEQNGIWNSGYDNLRDVENIRILAEQSGDKNFEAIALIMRSWMISLITDCYGDVPFSDAIQGKEGVYYPKYDTQEAIYNAILADLEKANSIAVDGQFVKGDLIYGGEMSNWKKLANSLRIRALMRISKKRDVSADLQAIVNNPGQFPIFTGNDDHAVYTYTSSNPDQFPLFSARSGSFNEFRAAKTMVDYQDSTADLRKDVFFRPTPASIGTDSAIIRGIPNGMDDVTAQTYYGGQQNHSQIGRAYYEDAVTEYGLSVAKGIVMTYAELQFLLAEAAEKGLISGSAETFYLNGINASFEFYSLTPDPAFFTQSRIAYTGSQDEKLEKIGNQKWVSLYFQGMEAWFDWRRTGFPKILPAVDNQNDDRIPVRFIYPIIEQALNGDNRTEAVNRMGGDDINTKMWTIQ